jgi:hypothetical protein
VSKYSFCPDCYYNHREPAICEECHNGSEFDAKEESDMGTRSATKPIKIVKKPKDFA